MPNPEGRARIAAAQKARWAKEGRKVGTGQETALRERWNVAPALG